MYLVWRPVHIASRIMGLLSGTLAMALREARGGIAPWAIICDQYADLAGDQTVRGSFGIVGPLPVALLFRS
jgi:hypothetical protein